MAASTRCSRALAATRRSRRRCGGRAAWPRVQGPRVQGARGGAGEGARPGECSELWGAGADARLPPRRRLCTGRPPAAAAGQRAARQAQGHPAAPHAQPAARAGEGAAAPAHDAQVRPGAPHAVAPATPLQPAPRRRRCCPAPATAVLTLSQPRHTSPPCPPGWCASCWRLRPAASSPTPSTRLPQPAGRCSRWCTPTTAPRRHAWRWRTARRATASA
jgi:hypothetical protein